VANLIKNMGEIVNTYLLTDPDNIIPMDRDEFYKEQIEVFEKTGIPTMAVEVVHCLIFNSDKEVIIQKRSFEKKQNAGLLDKSIGGHVQYGDTLDYTIMVETVQELQTPSIVLRNYQDFKKALILLGAYLNTIALINHSLNKIVISERIIDGKKVSIANKVNLFFGIYDGATKPVDKEAKGVLYYKLNEFIKEIDTIPQTFANDLIAIIKDFKPEIEKFFAVIDEVKK